MRTIFLALAIILLLAGQSFAAHVYGTLREADRPVQQGIPVLVTCAGNQHPGSTDAGGVYRIYVPEKGKCTIQVQYNGQQAAAEIYSFDDATKYDFDLVRQDNGYALRRR